MKFHYWIVLALGCIQMTARAAESDTTAGLLQSVEERLSPGGSFTSLLYGNPAAYARAFESSLTTLSLQGTYQQQQAAILPQIGRGERQTAFNADSYLHREANTLWGSAGYQVGRSMHTVWNENADYALLYPYVTADSVGGNLSCERYTFAGGFARETGPVIWSATADYRAQIEYRKVDPRPRSVVSDLKAAAGATLQVGKRYRIGLSLSGRLYRQRSVLQFYSPLGGPKEYLMLGLGMYSVRFSGSEGASDVYYKGSGYGATLDLIPVARQGFSLSLHYDGFSVQRILPDFQNLPLSRLRDHLLSGEWTWRHSAPRTDWGLKLNGSYGSRIGTEYLFGDASSSSNYPKIGESEQYRQHRATGCATAYATFRLRHDWSVSVEPRAQFFSFRSSYASPRRVMQIAKAGGGASLRIHHAFKRSMLQVKFDADYWANTSAQLELNGLDLQSTIGEMLQAQYAQLSSAQSQYGCSLRWDRLLPQRRSLFVDLAGYLGSLRNGNRIDYTRLTLGFGF